MSAEGIPPDLDALLQRGTGLPVTEYLPELCAAAATLAEDAILPRQRLSGLEALRPALWRALAEFEQQQLARTLPFSDAETGRWRSYIEGWSVLLGAYMRALADADQGAEGTAGLGDLLVQRVVRQAVQVAVACFRAYQPVEPALWLLLHEHLQRAEKAGVADLMVADPTASLDGRGSVIEAYLHLLLLDFCDPYGFSPSQLVLANRWTERLARQARLSLEPLSHGPAGFLVVDLGRGEGVRLLAVAPDPVLRRDGVPRFLDLGAAREQVKRLLAKLRLGMAPSELYLGEDCTRDEAEQVLDRILRRWRTSRRRIHPRRPVDEAVKIAVGLANAHRYLGHLEQGLPPDACEGLSASRLIDQSPSGLGLMQDESGPRLRCQQLLALAWRGEVLLGSVRWLTAEVPDGLRCGVRVMPGRVRAAHIQTSTTEPGTLEPALALSAMPALGEPASLIAVSGTFFPDRELRLVLGGAPPQLLRLERMLESGADFERISYLTVD